MSAPMRVVWLLLVLSLAISARADEMKDLANQAMRLSGSREILENLGKSVDMQLASDPRVAKLGNREKSELAAILKDVFDGRLMADMLTVDLVATGDRERLGAAVAAMRNPAYGKLNPRFTAASIKTTEQALIAYAKSFEKHPPDPRRVELIRRLDAATGASRLIADMKYEMTEKTLAGMLNEADRAGRLARLREQIDASAPEEYALRALYTVRKADIKDLDAYVAAHENEAMGWLARQLGYGIQRATMGAMGRMTEKLLDIVPQAR